MSETDEEKVDETNCPRCQRSMGPCPEHRVDRSVGPNDYMRDWE